MQIPVRNNLADFAQYSYLSNTEVAGTTVLRVKNINAYQSNWAVQIGQTGQEQSEIRLLAASAVSGTTLTVTAATSFEHPTDTPVFALKYNQIVYMRSTAGTAGTATAMTDGTVSIQPDSDYTVFDDTTAASTYAYKTKFRNSATGEESFESDWITPGGFNWYSLGKLRERVKGKLHNSGIIKDDDVIDDYLNEWYERMNAAAVKVNQDYSMGTVDIAFGTSGLGTISSSDFLFPTRVWVTYDGTNYSPATKQMSNDYGPNQLFDSARPYVSFEGDTVIRIQPSDVAGTARVKYQKLFTPLSNDGDELPLYMRNHTWTFTQYAYALALGKDEKFAEKGAENRSALDGLFDFTSSIVPHLRTGQTMIDIEEPITGEG